MATLSEFIGEIINDISKARSYADYASASISEQYFADPFIKNLPVPHYTIDEAEIEVPVLVVGIKTTGEQFRQIKDGLIDTVKQKLPLLIVQGYKFNYINEREEQQQKETKEKSAQESLNQEIKDGKAQGQRRVSREAVEKFAYSAEFLEAFAESAKKITERMTAHLEKYLNQYNYELLKLLDLSESFSRELMRAILSDIKTYAKDSVPYFSDAAVNRSSNFVGNVLFFEFKKIMRSDSGVVVDPVSSRMKEYAAADGNDCMMRIKIKVKEQDLNLITEERDGKERRYLSLT